MRILYLRTSSREIFYAARSSQPYIVKRQPILQICWSRTRLFMTSNSRHDNFAAPEFNFDQIASKVGGEFNDSDDRRPRALNALNEQDDSATCYARVVPESRSYFSVQPIFMDRLVALDQLLERYKHLPLNAPGDTPRTSWLSVQDYRRIVNEKVKNTRYQHLLRVLKRLNQIHPLYMPDDVKTAIQNFKRDTVPEAPSTKISPIDKLGRTLGVGRRKSATGRAWLVEGTGEVLVNGKTLAEAFGRIHDRETVIWPLKFTGRIDKYNLWCRVEGGGTTGQAEALTLAVSKALLGHEPALKPALRRAGCVTRDPRKVERKKPGRLKARKKSAWVKR